MIIDKEIYSGFVIEYHYNTDTKLFYATSKIANSNKKYDEKLKNKCGGFKHIEEAVDDVKAKMDVFLKTTPKTYSELASAISDSLVWTSHEDCYADEEIIKQLVSSFIKTQK